MNSPTNFDDDWSLSGNDQHPNSFDSFLSSPLQFGHIEVEPLSSNHLHHSLNHQVQISPCFPCGNSHEFQKSSPLPTLIGNPSVFQFNPQNIHDAELNAKLNDAVPNNAHFSLVYSIAQKNEDLVSGEEAELEPFSPCLEANTTFATMSSTSFDLFIRCARKREAHPFNQIQELNSLPHKYVISVKMDPEFAQVSEQDIAFELLSVDKAGFLHSEPKGMEVETFFRRRMEKDGFFMDYRVFFNEFSHNHKHGKFCVSVLLQGETVFTSEPKAIFARRNRNGKKSNGENKRKRNGGPAHGKAKTSKHK